MGAIYHEVWIDADRATVFEAITTQDGLDAWWGKAVSAEPRVGHVIEFDHGLGELLKMRITDLVPNERVAWRCVSDFSDPSNPASEWLAHQLLFELEDGAGVRLLGGAHDVTILRFWQTGWTEDSRWQGFCNFGWGMALNGLKQHCETRAANPGDARVQPDEPAEE